jgi:hypothetical protein
MKKMHSHAPGAGPAFCERASWFGKGAAALPAEIQSVFVMRENPDLLPGQDRLCRCGQYAEKTRLFQSISWVLSYNI